GVQELKKVEIETARLDAEVLLAQILNKDRIQLYLFPDEIIDENAEFSYKKLILQRTIRIPISYLTGHKEFMSLDFVVNRNVFIPRPETEILIENVCKLGKPESLVLDIGTGSGAIAVSLAKYNKNWRILATDISFKSLLVAKENAKLNDVLDRVNFLQTHLFSGISQKQRFDWVVSNPPYIPTKELPGLAPEISKYEPKIALDGGFDGLDIIRKLLLESHKILKPQGKLAMEIGHGQSYSIQAISDKVGKYSDYSIIEDYSGIPRVFCCQIKNSSV
ncbi:peptide chain release factor N(5)-glutamine methyltransferase, partial [Candidatus Poribacteria bacterium]|nr:peptide chain release factor N(5)-glutamine methyltransferase [Candidatus Poribacteria bacterium]